MLKSDPTWGISKTNSDLASLLLMKLYQTGLCIKAIKLYLGLADKLMQTVAPTH